MVSHAYVISHFNLHLLLLWFFKVFTWSPCVLLIWCMAMKLLILLNPALPKGIFFFLLLFLFSLWARWKRSSYLCCPYPEYRSLFGLLLKCEDFCPPWYRCNDLTVKTLEASVISEEQLFQKLDLSEMDFQSLNSEKWFLYSVNKRRLIWTRRVKKAWCFLGNHRTKL